MYNFIKYISSKFIYSVTKEVKEQNKRLLRGGIIE